FFTEKISNTLKIGQYIYNKTDEKISFFDKDFENFDDKLKSKLRLYNFDEKISKSSSLKIRVMKNVKLHGENKHFYACAQDGSYFDEENSARLAKSTRITYFKKTIKKINRAIILPIPHAPSNYYHSLSEMVYGLHLINRFDSNLPIIYSQDKFGLLQEVADRMSIDPSRFYSIDQVSDSIIENAFSIISGHFYWDTNFFKFFRSLVKDKTETSRKVYVSRKKSSRSLKNESNIENILSSNGFDIIYSEELSIKEQIELFASVDILISSHGAGLSNIAFMKKGTSLIEIFEDQSIVTHFYFRSRHNDMNYVPIFAKNKNLDISDLLAAIEHLSINQGTQH
uniref:glycosyltransferase family 61 protein n=1 Tax=Endozoicomonas arenosclerae TaxID=1633495 RepID=UPI000AC9A57D